MDNSVAASKRQDYITGSIPTIKYNGRMRMNEDDGLLDEAMVQSA